MKWFCTPSRVTRQEASVCKWGISCLPATPCCGIQGLSPGCPMPTVRVGGRVWFSFLTGSRWRRWCFQATEPLSVLEKSLKTFWERSQCKDNGPSQRLHHEPQGDLLSDPMKLRLRVVTGSVRQSLQTGKKSVLRIFPHMLFSFFLLRLYQYNLGILLHPF